MTDHFPAKNSFLNLLGIAVPALVGLVGTPFVVRGLGTVRFGIFSWVLVVMGYFGIFELGLSRATVRYVSDALGRNESRRIPQILWTAVGWQTVFGLAGGGLLAVSTPFLMERFLKMPALFQPEAKATMYWMAVALPINIILPSLRGALEAAQRFGLVNLIKIPTNSLMFLVPLIGVFLKLDLGGISLLLVFSRLLALAVWVWACLKVFPEWRSVSFLPKDERKPLFAFGVWNMLSNLVWFVLISLDRTLIGHRLGARAVGLYTPPSEAVSKLGMIPGSIALALFPAFSTLQSQGEPEKSKNLFVVSFKYTFLLSAPIVLGIVLFARTILRLWLGSEFAEAGTVVMQILAGGYLLQALTMVPYSYLQGIGRADLTTAFQVVELGLFAPLLMFAAKRWGIAGAAAAVSLRILLDLGLLFWASLKYGGWDSRAFRRDRFWTLVAFFAGFAVWGLAGQAFLRGLGTAVAFGFGLLIFARLVWTRILGPDEKARLRPGSKRT